TTSEIAKISSKKSKKKPMLEINLRLALLMTTHLHLLHLHPRRRHPHLRRKPDQVVKRSYVPLVEALYVLTLSIVAAVVVNCANIDMACYNRVSLLPR
ncbi:MAG TPA: hypothetical protein VEU97_00305, partial [Ktedonobacteraceae bacterium]|nr:hypothetical protein [Ktedonobacteraceae bacterium]